MSIVRAVVVTALLLAVAAGSSSQAQAINLNPDRPVLPVVEAGPAGHAVAFAGYGPVGVSFAAPGGSFVPVAGTMAGSPSSVAVDTAGDVLVASGGQVQAARFGGQLGPRTGFEYVDGHRLLVAKDPGGTGALAFIQRSRLRIARHAGLTPFAATVDAGSAYLVGGLVVAPDGTVHVIATRSVVGAPVLRSEAILVTLRPDRAEPETVTLDGVAGLALTRSTDGHLLAVSSTSGTSGMRFVVRLFDAAVRPAGGVHTLDPGSSHAVALGAILEAGGRAAIAWTVWDGGLEPYAAAVVEGDARSGFGPPRRLDRAGELSSAVLASNARGDAIVAWGALGHRPRAVLRAAGGQFGARMVVSPYEAILPTAGVLPDGRAVIGLSELAATRERHVVVRVGSGGAEARQVLAETSTVRIRPKGRARCRAARRGVLARTRFAVLRRISPSRREICSLVTGQAETLIDGVDFFDSIRLAGRFAAYGAYFDGGERSEPEVYVRVQDTRTGRSLTGLSTYIGTESKAIGDLVLTADGAFAVTVCDGAFTYAEAALTRRRCGRAGRAVEVVAVDGAGPSGYRVLARGRTIDPTSLRMRGRTASWRQAGATRSATLRPLRLPR